MAEAPIIIGVAGGSGSGKTTVTRSICSRFEAEEILVIEQDYYYKDQADIPFEERLKVNYDHPFAFDMDLLIEDVGKLMRHQAIDRPLYDYKAHTRAEKTEHVTPRHVIILEGILILEDARLRDLMDIKVFVDTDADLRFIRRLERDIEERGRSVDSVIHQYLADVRPAHLQFVEPTKRYADMIIPEGGSNHVAIDLLATKIEKIMQDK